MKKYGLNTLSACSRIIAIICLVRKNTKYWPTCDEPHNWFRILHNLVCTIFKGWRTFFTSFIAERRQAVISYRFKIIRSVRLFTASKLPKLVFVNYAALKMGKWGIFENEVVGQFLTLSVYMFSRQTASLTLSLLNHIGTHKPMWVIWMLLMVFLRKSLFPRRLILQVRKTFVPNVLKPVWFSLEKYKTPTFLLIVIYCPFSALLSFASRLLL